MTLHPDFPVVANRFRLTREWELDLPEKFNQRVEEGSMVLWRPGRTFWIAVWGPGPDKTPEETLAWIPLEIVVATAFGLAPLYLIWWSFTP